MKIKNAADDDDDNVSENENHQMASQHIVGFES